MIIYIKNPSSKGQGQKKKKNNTSFVGNHTLAGAKSGSVTGLINN